MLETPFKRDFKERLKEHFPGCILVDVDPTNFRSFPDLLFLYKTFWAALEFKKAHNSTKRPNQSYWVSTLADMSFSMFVHPDNQHEVLNELHRVIENR